MPPRNGEHQRDERIMPRPRFKPTKENRKLVKSLAVLGIRHEQIIKVIGLRSPKTLRKHFRKELSRGYAEATATVSRVAYEMAISGKYPVLTDFWVSAMDRSGRSLRAAEESSSRRQGTVKVIDLGAGDTDSPGEESDTDASA